MSTTLLQKRCSEIKRTVLSTLAVELVRLKLIRKVEEHATGVVRRGVLPAWACNALHRRRRDRRDGKSQSQESGRELEGHVERRKERR